VVSPLGFAVTGTLDPSSDLGASPTDRITNDNTPTFSGQTAPGAPVQVFAERVEDQILGGIRAAQAPISLGQTVADATGRWFLTSSVPLAEESYAITVKASLPGVTVAATTSLGSLIVDTVGPRIQGVALQPRRGRITLTVQDDRVGMDVSTVIAAGRYKVSRYLSPIPPRPLAVTAVEASAVATSGTPQVVTLVLNGGRRIAHARLRLIAEGLADLAGNLLDGEFAGNFPTGDGQPGGAFVVRQDTARGRVSPPRALDAAGRPLAVSYPLPTAAQRLRWAPPRRR
jgi:hypothetical protein